jgi:hypothetical protein
MSTPSAKTKLTYDKGNSSGGRLDAAAVFARAGSLPLDALIAPFCCLDHPLFDVRLSHQFPQPRFQRD